MFVKEEDITPDLIYSELMKLVTVGMVDYVLPDNENAGWVLGMDGGLFFLNDVREASIFLTGVHRAVYALAKKKGVVA